MADPTDEDDLNAVPPEDAEEGSGYPFVADP